MPFQPAARPLADFVSPRPLEVCGDARCPCLSIGKRLAPIYRDHASCAPRAACSDCLGKSHIVPVPGGSSPFGPDFTRTRTADSTARNTAYIPSPMKRVQLPDQLGISLLLKGLACATRQSGYVEALPGIYTYSSPVTTENRAHYSSC
jgi:hypothetical protein